ncbi:MAG: Gfo/Idh/MocA family oxidoreductase, partial [Proteobacteria bacterium]|nr:Gfo/Idh/MocA family oxidoreductase [Pseudomonadota bacterium]
MAPVIACPLRLGVIGASPGNGHPYSWSAIFNGYDPDAMARCPYPAVPDYLSRQRFPEDAIGGAAVTTVWTQDRAVSEDIAAASLIGAIADSPDAMAAEVDAVLLARDDAASHMRHAAPALEAGLPIYIDKPLALSVEAAEALFAKETVAGQIFSCSALAYAPEFRLGADDRQRLGALRRITATTPKAWDTYAMHLIDPVAGIAAGEGALVSTIPHGDGGQGIEARWESGLVARLTATGELPSPLRIVVEGERGTLTME